MYGLEGILGNLVTSVATPAVGGIMGDIASSAVEDQLLKEITQTTVGALSGAAVGAGLGALTGGKSGALSGALTGGVGGGVGGYNAPQISQMFGMNQSAGAPQGGQIAAPPPVAMDYNLSSYAAKPIPGIGAASIQQVPNIQQPAAQPISPTPPPPQSSGFKDYTQFLKENYEPLAGGFFLGSAYGANQDTQDQGQQRQQQQVLKNMMDAQNARRFSRSAWGYADGGPVEVGLANPQISVHFPAWAQEQIQREGGLAALQPGIKQGMAQGGYINLQPMGETMHPQGLIPKAQPYAAATPQRREVVQDYGDTYARGGLIDGPGDGQSDDIPANISGKEEVRVADGEYVIPKEIAAKYGPDKLKRMMTKVRAAAHAKKGKQIVQGAAQREFIKTLSGVKA
jgi:hypothetical protein